MPLVLALETSCDETAAAVVEDGHLVRADVVASQIEVHRKYGGVVPELASRNHVVDVVPVVREALEAAGITGAALDAVAVTQGPGLVGALLVGLQTAKAIAYALDKPLIPVHHLSGHLHAIHLHAPDAPRPPAPRAPFVALAVSGGHTALYLVAGPGQITQLANTRDDAAGEAFDKVARMLGLGYPGGPVIERLARGGDPARHAFTRPRFKDGGALDFSFSGLKTAVLTLIERHAERHGGLPADGDLADLLASFQAAAVDQLVERTVTAARSAGARDVVLAGGVACNAALRAALEPAVATFGARLLVPPPRWCTDNAAMIAAAADAPAAARLAIGPAKNVRADRQLNARSTWPLVAPDSVRTPAP